MALPLYRFFLKFISFGLNSKQTKPLKLFQPEKVKSSPANSMTKSFQSESTSYEKEVLIVENNKTKQLNIKIVNYSLIRESINEKTNWSKLSSKTNKVSFLYLTKLINGRRAKSYNTYMRFEAPLKPEDEIDFVFANEKDADEFTMKVMEIVSKIMMCNVPNYAPKFLGKIPDDLLIEEKNSENQIYKNLLYYHILCDAFDEDPLNSVKIGFLDFRMDTIELKELFISQKHITEKKLQIIAKILKDLEHSYKEVILNNFPLSDFAFERIINSILSNKKISGINMSNCSVTSGAVLEHIPDILKPVDENDLNKTQLNSIDLSGNSKLGTAGIRHLCRGLAYTKMDYLNLSNCGLDYKGIESIKDAICSKESQFALRFLDLSKNAIGKPGSLSLTKFLENSQQLEVLRLANTDANLDIILSAILKNKFIRYNTLREIDFSFCKMTAFSASMVAQMLRYTKKINTLVLKGTRLNNQCLKKIFRGLLDNHDSLEGNDIKITIDLSENDFDGIEKGIIPEICRCLRVLDLSGCGLKAKGLINIKEDLENLKQLHTLKIDRNIKSQPQNSPTNIKFGETINDLVRSIPSLEFLSINGGPNYNINQELDPLFKSLLHNKTLLRLDMEKNRIGDESIDLLIKSLKNNITLKVLKFDENRLSSKKLIQLLNQMLRSLNLRGKLPLNDIETHLKTRNIYDKLNLEKIVDYINKDPYMRFCEDNLCEYERKIFKKMSESELECIKGKQFGIDPTDIIGTVKIPNLLCRIPTVLIKMTDYLFEKNGHLVTGIFRISPDKNQLDIVQKEFDQDIFESCEDIHCVAECIKLWFRLLPEPIFDGRFIKSIIWRNNFLKNNRMRSFSNPDQYREKDMKTIVESGMTEPYLSLFYWLIDFIVKISCFEKYNKMTRKNLAIVFIPNLIGIRGVDLSKSQEACKFLQDAIEWWANIKNIKGFQLL